MTEEETIKAYEELVQFLVKPLLGDTEFKVKSRARGNNLSIEVKAPADVRGRIIGRGGRIARSLRSVVETAAIADDMQVSFDIAD